MSGKTKRNLSPQEKGFFYLCVFIVALLLSLIPPRSTLARTWYIKADGTADAPTIQAGVDSAAVGDTVMVGAGTYSDTVSVVVDGKFETVNVCIRKGITLMGNPIAERPIIDGAETHIGIYVENSPLAVGIGHLEMRRLESWPLESSGIADRNSTAGRDYPARIRCLSSSVVVYDVVAFGDHDGICVSSSTVEVRDSRFRDLAVAVVCLEASDVAINDNIVFDCNFGVWCEGSAASICGNAIGAAPPAVQNSGVSCTNSSLQILGNDIEWCGNGVSVSGGSVTIEANKFFKNDYGVQQGACLSVIHNNVFYNNGYAVWSTSGCTGQVMNNTMDACGVGVYSELGASQLVRGNVVTRGVWGIQCALAALTVECNDIFEMSDGLYDWSCGGEPSNTNFSADPQYCGIDDSGNYYLQSDSPCAPGNHPDGFDCGLLGAFPVNCGIVATKGATWGALKARFGNGGE